MTDITPFLEHRSVAIIGARGTGKTFSLIEAYKYHRDQRHYVVLIDPATEHVEKSLIHKLWDDDLFIQRLYRYTSVEGLLAEEEQRNIWKSFSPFEMPGWSHIFGESYFFDLSYFVETGHSIDDPIEKRHWRNLYRLSVSQSLIYAYNNYMRHSRTPWVILADETEFSSWAGDIVSQILRESNAYFVCSAHHPDYLSPLIADLAVSINLS